jgi:phage FluMu protein Com
MKEAIKSGSIEIKCPRCNTFNLIEREIIVINQGTVLETIDTIRPKCNTENIEN